MNSSISKTVFSRITISSFGFNIVIQYLWMFEDCFVDVVSLHRSIRVFTGLVIIVLVADGMSINASKDIHNTLNEKTLYFQPMTKMKFLARKNSTPFSINSEKSLRQNILILMKRNHSIHCDTSG